MDFSTARCQTAWMASVSSTGSWGSKPRSALPAAGAQCVERAPHALGQAGQGGGAERGGLGRARARHGHPALLGLQLAGGGPWRRRPRRPAARTGGGPRRPPWHRSCRAPGRPWPPRRPAPAGPGPAPRVRPVTMPRAAGSHHGLPRPVSAGTKVTPPLSGDRLGQRPDLGGIVDDAEPVAQPLDGGAGDEGRPLERVGHRGPRAASPACVAQVPGAADGQALGRGRALGAGVGQHEAAGAVGDLDHAGVEAGLAEQRGLLVAQHARDRDAVQHRRGRAEVGRARPVPKRPADGRTSGSVCGGHPEEVAQLGGPGERGRIEAASCGWRWRGPWRTRRLVPPVRFHSTQVSTVPKARSGSVGGEGEVSVAQQPGALVALKYGSSTRPVALPHRGEVAGVARARRRWRRCAGPARRWPGAAAGRSSGRRRPASRAGW